MSTAEATAEQAPAEQAAAGQATAKPRRKMKFKFKLMLILSSILMMVFLRTGFIFVLVATMPAIVCYYIDRSSRMHLFKSVFACNLSGVLPYIGRMLMEGPAGSLIPIMRSIDTWIVIYGAAFIGYLLVSVTPIVAHMLLGKFQIGQVDKLEASLKKIEREWGSEVLKFSKPEEKA